MTYTMTNLFRINTYSGSTERGSNPPGDSVHQEAETSETLGLSSGLFTTPRTRTSVCVWGHHRWSSSPLSERKPMKPKQCSRKWSVSLLGFLLLAFAAGCGGG